MREVEAFIKDPPSTNVNDWLKKDLVMVKMMIGDFIKMENFTSLKMRSQRAWFTFT